MYQGLTSSQVCIEQFERQTEFVERVINQGDWIIVDDSKEYEVEGSDPGLIYGVIPELAWAEYEKL